jgi:predicted DNA-binding transcriptional regulator AlpA
MNNILIIRPKQLANALGISQTTLFRMRQRGEIPEPILFGSKMVGWKYSTITNWVDAHGTGEK